MSVVQSAPGRADRDQASGLRAMVESLRPREAGARAPAGRRAAPVVAVTSGKGGVGKTSLCVNLCIALARGGLRVTLVDADLGMANADVMCGISPAQRLERVVGVTGAGPSLQGRPCATLRQIAVQAPGGFRLIPGSVGIAHMAGLDADQRGALVGALGDLGEDCDVVVVDTGAGVSPGVTSFVQAADLVAVVVTPEPTSIADAYAMIKCLRRGLCAGQVIGLAVNQAVDAAEAGAVHGRIAAVAHKFLGFRPALLGWIPADPAVGRAVRARRPLLLGEPRAAAASAIVEFGRSLSARLELRVERAERRGILGAVSAWFSRSGGADRAGFAGG